MQEEPTLPNDQPAVNPGVSSPPLAQPPLSISQLMLWTLGSAIILSVTRMMPRPQTISQVAQILEVVSQVLMSGLYGIKLAALFVFLSRAVMRNGPLPREPGHWLLLSGGVGAVVTWVTYWLLFSGSHDEVNYVLKAVSIFVIILYGTSGGLALASIIGLAGRRALGWQFLFGYVLLFSLVSVGMGVILLSEALAAERDVAAVVGGATIFFLWNQSQPWVEHLPLLLGISGLLIWDRVLGQKRDWLHFAGVWTEIGMLLLLVAMRLARIS